jgi:hypothetical protein
MSEYCNVLLYKILIGGAVIFIAACLIYNLCFKKNGTWSNWKIEDLIASKPEPIKKRSNVSKGEQYTKQALETIFNKPFVKSRPDWAKNPVTGENLECDCWNADLKICCEYNGRQHYEHIGFFHKTREAFHNQQYRDILKKDMAKKNGITFIEIPYTVKNDDIENYIRQLQITNK